MKYTTIYNTYGSQEQAEAISEGLVEQGLVACANILAPHTAIYRWRGEVNKDKEIAVLYKTAADKFEEVKAFIRMHHDYDCPYVLSWPVDKIHQPFAEWIDEQTR